MKSKSKTYKRLGDYIELVNVRNTDLKVDYLVGLTINKKFIPSVANTIGTNMANYKIIEKNQFACSLMQVSRDGKIPIARFEEEVGIMSPAYPVFKVVDETALLPAYLMMWFEREEFDREAAYYAVGGVRGNLTWDDFCDMKLPVPSIEKQQQIVDEYQSIENKIKVNEQICEQLEDTAQAIYREWFVEFNFPDEDGKPFKDNGGKMVWSDELDKEVPEGWEVRELSEVTEIKAGGDRPKEYSDYKTSDFNVPIFSNGIANEGLYGFTNKANYEKGSITVSARGTIGYCVLRNMDFDAIVRLLVLTPKLNNLSVYLWHTLKTVDFVDSGSVQKQLTVPQISNILIPVPLDTMLQRYDLTMNVFYDQIKNLNDTNESLEHFKSLLLVRMVK